MGYRIEQAREAMRRPFETPGQRCAWRTVFVSAIVLLVLIIKIEYDHSRYVQHVSIFPLTPLFNNDRIDICII